MDKTLLESILTEVHILLNNAMMDKWQEAHKQVDSDLRSIGSEVLDHIKNKKDLIDDYVNFLIRKTEYDNGVLKGIETTREIIAENIHKFKPEVKEEKGGNT